MVCMGMQPQLHIVPARPSRWKAIVMLQRYRPPSSKCVLRALTLVVPFMYIIHPPLRRTYTVVAPRRIEHPNAASRPRFPGPRVRS